MRIETLTPPATDALLLGEIRTHLRTDSAEDDAALATLARTAEAMMEAHLGLALVNRDVALYLDRFPTCEQNNTCWWQGMREGPMSWLSGVGRALELPLRPLIAISKVEVWQGDGWQEWAAANYSVSPGLLPLLHLAGGNVWPMPSRPADGIRITARTGFGEDWNAVPATIRHAMLQLVAWLYTHKGDEPGENAVTASGAASMVNAYRRARL
jgi:hypothetical protein